MKVKKIIILALGCILMCGCFSGCEATSKDDETSYIVFNSAKGIFDMNNVTYWDFMYNELKERYSGEDCFSKDLSKTTIEFIDAEGIGRSMKLNKSITSKPKKVNIYVNKEKTKYETYNMEF